MCGLNIIGYWNGFTVVCLSLSVILPSNFRMNSLINTIKSTAEVNFLLIFDVR